MDASVHEDNNLFNPQEMRSMLQDVETNLALHTELDADDARFSLTEGVGLPIYPSQLIHDNQEGENVTYFSKAVLIGSVYTSELVVGENWTPYVHVTVAGVKKIAKVLHFVQSKTRSKRMRAVCRKVRVSNISKFVPNLTHVLAAMEENEFFVCDIKDLGDRLYKIRQFLTAMPFANLRGFFHNDAA
jgi:hypothetical protein